MDERDSVTVPTTTMRLVEATLHKLKTYSKTAKYASPSEQVWDPDDDITLNIVSGMLKGDGNV